MRPRSFWLAKSPGCRKLTDAPSGASGSSPNMAGTTLEGGRVHVSAFGRTKNMNRYVMLDSYNDTC